MQPLIKYFLGVFTLLVLSLSVFASATTEGEEEAFNPTEFIMHHIADAYEWHIFDIPQDDGSYKPVSLPLPIILLNDGKLDIFSSGKFEHGHKPVTVGENTYVIHHNKIYTKKDEVVISKDSPCYIEFECHGQHEFFNTSEFYNDSGTVIVQKDANSYSLVDNKVFCVNENEQEIGGTEVEYEAFSFVATDFSITKNVASMFFAALLLLLIFGAAARAYKKRPGTPKGLQSFMEPIVLFVRDDIAIPNIGHKKADRYVPYLLTVFFFIWINNMLGIIPFFPGAANVTGNISVTMVLATFTLLITNFSANKNYWKHIFAMPGLPLWLLPIMIPVEIIGVFAKPFALMIRLFANISAGHIIVMSLVSLIFIFKSLYIAPVSVAFVLFIDVLELFVAALQAYIFAMLSALFIGLAVAEDH